MPAFMDGHEYQVYEQTRPVVKNRVEKEKTIGGHPSASRCFRDGLPRLVKSCEKTEFYPPGFVGPSADGSSAG